MHTTHSPATRLPATHSLVWTQWVASVDLFANEDAHANIVVTATDSWTQQGEEVFPSYNSSSVVSFSQVWRGRRQSHQPDPFSSVALIAPSIACWKQSGVF